MLKPFNGGQVPCQTAFCLIFSVQNFPTDKAAALIGQSSACALVAGGVQIRADGKRQVFRVSGKKESQLVFHTVIAPKAVAQREQHLLFSDEQRQACSASGSADPFPSLPAREAGMPPISPNMILKNHCIALLPFCWVHSSSGGANVPPELSIYLRFSSTYCPSVTHR